jgi:aspartate aminotransferase-like enzyme
VFLLLTADVSASEYAAVLIQGSGTYAVEATFSTCVPRQNAKVDRNAIVFLFVFINRSGFNY